MRGEGEGEGFLKARGQKKRVKLYRAHGGTTLRVLGSANFKWARAFNILIVRPEFQPVRCESAVEARRSNNEQSPR